MLGLGLGAIIGGKIAERITDKIRLYFFIELAIGAFGLISIPFMDLVGKNTATSGYAMSFVCMFALLSVPTILMGITLPLLTKIFNSAVKNFLQSLSYLYFINTLGAAVGALITSYILISFGGLDISVYVAAAINIAIAVAIWMNKQQLTTCPVTKDLDPPSNTPLSEGGTMLKPAAIYAIVFATGFIAIGYEIIWFRIISTIVKASPYSFSTVLSIYLLGIALGSYLMKKILGKRLDIDGNAKQSLFFTFQVAIACYVLCSIAAYHYLVNNVPFVYEVNFNSFNNLFHPSLTPPPNYRIGSLLMWLLHKSDIIVWPALFILVPTVLMGASFPLITSLAHTKGRDADTVGKVYFYNVLGNVTGGLFTGLLLLHLIGTEYSLLLLSFSGLLFIFFKGRVLAIRHNAAKAGIIAVAICLSIMYFPGRQQLYKTIHPKYIFNIKDKVLITEGSDGAIVTFHNGPKVVTFINGMSHGGRPNVYYLHEAIQTLSYKKPKRVLVIGLGTGTIIEVLKAVSPLPQVTVVELSQALLDNLQQIDTLHSLLSDKHVQIVCADGRNFLYRNMEQYDAVFMDPLRTTTSFSNNIYSKQFFELVSTHLTHDGVLMTWSDDAYVVPRTLCTVFPHVNMYSFFGVCSKSKLKEDTAYKTALTNQFPAPISEEIKRYAAAEAYPRNRAAILNDTKGYRINEDHRPVCEYFIGYRGSQRATGLMFYPNEKR